MQLFQPFQRYFLIVIVSLLLSSCGFSKQYNHYYNEVNQRYSAPDKLDGDVSSSGILLIDAVSKKALNTLSLSGVALINLAKPEEEILVGSFSSAGFFSQNSGIVIVPNLQPGIYRLTKLKTHNANFSETVFIPPLVEYQVEIKAGQPGYLGQFIIEHPFGTLDRKITLKNDPTRVLDCWEMVIQHFKDSAWIDVIRQNIETSK